MKVRQPLSCNAFRVALTLTLFPPVLWTISGLFSTPATARDDEYVGSEACKDCHEDQFKNFVPTSHARLDSLGSWKNKVTGCESCMDQVRRTWRKVIRRKSSRSRTNHPSRFPKLASSAMPEERSTTTSGVENTGAMILAAPSVILS